MNQVIAAAILVHACASIEIRRINVSGFTVRDLADNYLAPAFRWAHFDPIDIIAGNSWLTQPNRPFYN
jgi:hypothetical protein